MAAFAYQIGNHPVLLPLLGRLDAQGQQLRSAQAAANQHGDHRVIWREEGGESAGGGDAGAALWLERLSLTSP
jgi:hypothetical protein